MMPENQADAPLQTKEQLLAEIAELEQTKNQLSAYGVRIMRRGCLSLLLLTGSAAGVWLVPHPMPWWQVLLFVAALIAGADLFLHLAPKPKKSAEQIKQETARIQEITFQIKEKKEQLARLKKS
jgi:hypothetical protein